MWKSLSRVWHKDVTPWTIACQAPLSMVLQARILKWVVIPFPGDLPDPGIQPGSPALQADSLPSEPPGEPVKLLLPEEERGGLPDFLEVRLWKEHALGHHKTINRKHVLPFTWANLGELMFVKP